MVYNGVLGQKMTKCVGRYALIGESYNRGGVYLELLGEVVGDDGSEGREEGRQEHADIADVNRDVEKMKNVIQGCRCDHQPW